MIRTKLYLYDSSKADYKGTDYTSNIKAGVTYTDDLTEVLDTCDITLVGLTTSQEFDPTTKFILEQYDIVNGSEVLFDTYHLCVMEDVVSQPILSDGNYFNHAISFIEASAIAQGRMVDNMALTYKLKDVSINVAPTFDVVSPANPLTHSAYATLTSPNGYSTDGNWFHTIHQYKISRRFDYDWTNSGGSINDWKNVKQNMLNDSNSPTTITLPIPLITTQFGEFEGTGYDSHKNYCSVNVCVYKKAFGSDTWVAETGYPLQVNPSKNDATEGDWRNDWVLTETYNTNKKGYGINRIEVSDDWVFLKYFKKYAEFDETIQNRSISLTLVSGYEYRVYVSPVNFITSTSELNSVNYLRGDGSTLPTTYSVARIDQYPITHNVSNQSVQTIATSPSTDGTPLLAMNFNVYEIGSTQSYQFESAPPVSAYDLFTEAQLKSQLTLKEDNIFIKDMPLPYYCDDNDIDVLKNTQVMESTFNQKNYWEILLEIGKYIHAIPYIEFGVNDRFVVRWRYLGQTDQAQDDATTISIFNSRSIENYVGALSSYVNNLMQLGGQIDEWTCAKSESDDYLVYNDVAKIYTTKPIMQIDNFYIKCIHTGTAVVLGQTITLYTSGTSYEATDYIFEKNVYDLLDITETYTTNKGKAIYYRLGDNRIDGLTYQLPAINNGDTNTDYAIKRIIGTLFNISQSNWKYIKINDFAFHIVYRTKEDDRSEQSRPDLRKYLVNSAYEYIPHHKQFNNQQDKMVDSVKFGNQNYGKLIRTGNTEYKTTEWNNALSQLKIAGQLVNIRGNIYYVTKATHTYYQDHITSEITYSKDYNQLSEIIGIPSEPRFFEISEQSMIDRHQTINDLLFLSTNAYTDDDNIPHFLRGDAIEDLIMGNVEYPKYAITSFTDDNNNPNPNDLFFIDIIKPISAFSMRNTLNLHWEMVDNFSAGQRVEDTSFKYTGGDTTDTAYSRLINVQYTDKYGRSDLMKFVILKDLSSTYLTKDYLKNLPISPLRLLYSDAKGFSNVTLDSYEISGTPPTIVVLNPLDDWISLAEADYIIDNGGNVVSPTNYYVYMVDDGTYLGLYIYYPQDLGEPKHLERIFLLPSGSDITKITDYLSIAPYNGSGAFAYNWQNPIGLIKDCRERIKFNYNLQMLTDSDRFVLSGYLWQQNKGTIKLALLNTEVNKIINDTIPAESIIGYDPNDSAMSYLYNVTSQQDGSYGFKVNIASALSGLTDAQKSAIKGIALVSTAVPTIGNGRNIYFTMARNVSDLSNADKIVDWHICPTDKKFFKRQ